MEVQSIHVEQDEEFVSLSLQDLNENRIDGTIDLLDSYRLQGFQTEDASCTWVGHQEEEKHRTIIPLNKAEQTLNMMSVPWNGLSVACEPYLEGEQNELIKILHPTLGLNLSDYLALSGLAYQGGRLHVQTAEQNAWGKDSQIKYFLMVDGEEQEELYGVSTALVWENGALQDYRVSHGYDHGKAFVNYNDAQGNSVKPTGDVLVKRINESVFALTEEELKRATLKVEWRTSEEPISGDWQVTFDLDENTSVPE